MNKILNMFFVLMIIFSISGCKDSKNSDAETKQIWSKRIADSFVDRHPGNVVFDSLFTKKTWNYEQGLILEALKQEYFHSGDTKYYSFIKGNIDHFIREDGSIKTYEPEKFNLDKIAPGRSLLYLYQVTGEEKYKIAADHLMNQIKNQPKTKSGGFWHKKRYPNQMWLDGLYMAEPFRAEYTKAFSNYEDLNSIFHEFELIYKNVLDEKTGLLYHAWDESRKEKWANELTGASSNFWGRAIGWYLMGIVDILDYTPKSFEQRDNLIKILNSVSEALLKVKDDKTNLWYQVLNLPTKKGNYLETSASAMYAYAFAKGYNKGYLPQKFITEAKETFDGLIEYKVKFDENGYVDLYGTCKSAGLGGKPYRDGSFDYYISEPTRKNDIKGYGPFLLAAIEIEKAEEKIGKGITIGLDYYFNNEFRINKITGKKERYHYTWEDTTNSGYSEFGKIFKSLGANIISIKEKPSFNLLNTIDAYIIVDPDTKKENENPHYIEEKDVETITKWVSEGGFLLLFSNDSSNAEFEKFNSLAEVFGFRFNEVSLNKVINKNYEMGAFTSLPNHPIFSCVDKIYMKEISTISVTKPEHTILKLKDNGVIVFRKFGDGFVLALSDPWLYNEYIDNRRLPKSFENKQAAENLVKWVLGIIYRK